MMVTNERIGLWDRENEAIARMKKKITGKIRTADRLEAAVTGFGKIGDVSKKEKQA